MKSAHRVQSRTLYLSPLIIHSLKSIHRYLDKILFETKIEIGTDCFKFVANKINNKQIKIVLVFNATKLSFLILLTL
jgi:hypothetical protein